MSVVQIPSDHSELLEFNEYLSYSVLQAQLGASNYERTDLYRCTDELPYIEDNRFGPPLFATSLQAGDAPGFGVSRELSLGSYRPVSSTGMTVGLPTPSMEYPNSTCTQVSGPPLSGLVPIYDQGLPLHSLQSPSPPLSNDCVTRSPKSKENDGFPQRAASAPEGRNKPRRKTHNAIEKRYRTRLNDKIGELRDRIPSLRHQPTEGAEGQHMAHHSAAESSSHKINKANILEKATEYILHLEACNRRLQMQMNQALLASRPCGRRHKSAMQQQNQSLDPGSSSSASMLSQIQPQAPFNYTVHDLLPNDTANYGH